MFQDHRGGDTDPGSGAVGGDIQFPRRDAGHVDRQPQSFFVVADPLVRAGQGLGALRHPQFEIDVDLLQGDLGSLALGHLMLELFVQGHQRARLLVQLGEDRDLRAKHVGTDRFAQVVDAAHAVGFEHLLLLRDVGREEENRHIPRAVPLLDQGGQLDAVHIRHPDVEDQRPEVLPQHRQQGLVGGVGPHQRAAERLEHHLQRVEVARLIVDDQDLDAFVVHGADASQRYNHTRSSDSNWSWFTGLAM